MEDADKEYFASDPYGVCIGLALIHCDYGFYQLFFLHVRRQIYFYPLFRHQS